MDTCPVQERPMDPLVISCPQCRAALRVRDRGRLGQPGRCSKCGHRFTLTEALARTFQPPAPAADSGGAGETDSEPAAPAAEAALAGGLPNFEEIGTEALPGVASRRLNSKHKLDSRKVGLIVGSILAAALLAIYAFTTAARQGEPAAPAADVPGSVHQATPERTPEVDSKAIPDGAQAEAAEPQGATSVPAAKREPIQLWGMPGGSSLIVHLHPSAFFREEGRGDELQRCLGEFGRWCVDQLQTICAADPVDVETATICLLYGAPGTVPGVAAAVEVASGRSEEILTAFGGERSVAEGFTVYKQNGRVLVVRDERSYCVGPEQFLGEMIENLTHPALPVGSLRELLYQTDAARMLSVVFDPRDARQHAERIAPESARGLLVGVCDWIDPARVEAAAWSVEFNDRLEVELLLRNRPAANDAIVTERDLARDVAARLDALPREILRTVEKMRPVGTGRRKVVGRFPAMVKAFTLSTRLRTENRLVAVQTILPDVAAPNLALAARLAWDEVTP